MLETSLQKQSRELEAVWAVIKAARDWISVQCGKQQTMILPIIYY
jgi:hypothetical protein